MNHLCEKTIYPVITVLTIFAIPELAGLAEVACPASNILPGFPRPFQFCRGQSGLGASGKIVPHPRQPRALSDHNRHHRSGRCAAVLDPIGKHLWEAPCLPTFDAHWNRRNRRIRSLKVMGHVDRRPCV